MSNKVAVYGTLKRGHGNHDIMQVAGGKFVGKKTIPDATMYDLGAFPAVSFDGGEGVVAEIYEVDDMKPIDNLEGYPILYNRHQVETEYGDVWVYNMSPRKTLGMEVVPEGVW